MLSRRDLRTVYFHEMGIYEAKVPLLFLRTGVPALWFCALQWLGHFLSAFVSNKFYWMYGRQSPQGLGEC